VSARISAIGVAAAPHVRAQTEAMRDALSTGRFTEAQSKRIERIYDRTGIARRAAVLHDERLANGNPMGFLPRAESDDDRGPTTAQRMKAYELCAPDLAIDASRNALSDSAHGPRGVTHLVTVSCTGSASPGVDHALIEGLGLPTSVARTNIGFMGCHGALNGLRVALAFAESDPSARVLLACVELCSLHYYYGWDAEKVIANALFADGAASAIIDGSPGNGPSIAGTASHVIPDSRDEMGWAVRDHGFEMTLTRRVPELIEQHAGGWASDWLRAHGLRISDIASWAIHPGGPRILSAVQRALGLTDEQMTPSRNALENHGNMSSPTVLVILKELLKRPDTTPCVALAFGPGLSIEAMLLR